MNVQALRKQRGALPRAVITIVTVLLKPHVGIPGGTLRPVGPHKLPFPGRVRHESITVICVGGCGRLAEPPS